MKKTIALIVLATMLLSTAAQARGGRTAPDDCPANSKKPECVDTDSDDPPPPKSPPAPQPPPPPKKPG
jgi:hypothetical protein